MPAVSKKSLQRLHANMRAIRLDKKVVQGEEEIRRRIQALERGVAKKIMVPASREALKVIAKTMRREIPARFKNARRGVGWRVRKGKINQDVQSKVGVAVGKKRAKLAAIQKEASASRPRGRGVGIGARNFHWAVLGTGTRTRKDGTSTGAMRAKFPGFAARAASSAGMASKAAMLRRARIELRKVAK